MKRSLVFGFAIALLGACSIKEIDIETPVQDDVAFYASFEQPTEDATRVYANEDLLLRWTADDRVSIFEKNTYNQQFRFTGETGDNAGGFKKVGGDDYYTGNSITNVVSVYPYLEATKITESGVLTVDLPAEQHYAENTFGLGANTMVSVSSDNYLQYKNAGGYLMLKLYGEGVSISSITLKGNNGEKLAGKASVTMPLNGVPSVEMATDAETSITLKCPTPVQLDATVEECTEFWFVVPPVTFSEGFTITIVGDDGVFSKTTEKFLTIDRNKLSKMSPIKVELSSPRNVIYYTSSDASIVTPRTSDVFGAEIVSNEYVDGMGVLTFNSEVTIIGEDAFRGCTSLTSITLPSSVTSIGNRAFQNCFKLSSVILPNSLLSIGHSAFGGCLSLTNFIIPDSVISIDNHAFQDCNSLTNINIPHSVTSIGFGVFAGCNSLLSFSGKYSSSDGMTLINSNVLLAVAFGSIDGHYSIPQGVTSIGDYTFHSCTSLTSISIPGNITSIGVGVFQDCTSLSDIKMPQELTSIGIFAFSNCTSLTGITIPNHVESIGVGAFLGCNNLLSLIVLPEIPPSGQSLMFSYTNNCPIYVPAGSVEAYKSADGWSEYADRIQALAPLPEVVDLGLPSGLKWASFNLGASKPEEFGDFYAWGETETKEYYDWDNYKWSNGLSLSASTNNYLTKYNSNSDYGLVDNKSVLDPEDDVAHVKLGSNWRIPTQQEFVELSQNCDWVRATVNGITGYLVKSRINSNSIFLYYSDWPYPKNLNDPNNDLIEGNYWSANSCNNPPSSAYRLLITPDGVFPNAYARRCHGRNIRPVYAE